MRQSPSRAAACLRATVCAFGLCLALSPVRAEDVNLSYLEGKLPVAPDAITAAGPELFGEKVNLYNGALEFEHTDLSLPGNNGLSVALSRRHAAGRPKDVKGQFGDWDLEVPRIGGTFTSTLGWVTDSGGTNRCSGWTRPPSVTVTIALGGKAARGEGDSRIVPTPPAPPAAGWDALAPAAAPLLKYVTFLPFDYWQGISLTVPGQGSQELLSRASGYGTAPGGASASYPIVTRNNWQIGCLPSVLNAAGEGFYAVSPTGVRYTFNWMARRIQPNVKKEGAPLGRQDYFLMATEATDRFGNWVRYTYDPQTPLNLQRIEASDGRSINISNVGGQAASASDGTRTYVYGYTVVSGVNRLTSVTQPDGGRWTFNLGPLLYNNLSEVGDVSTCDFPGSYPNDALTGSMTHPSGARGTFTMNYVSFGRTGVPRYCWNVLNSKTLTYGAVYPRLFITQALTTKTIEGPGMATLAWNYSYAPSSGWDTCTTCPDISVTTLTDPGGVATRHTFGNRWRVNDGQMLKTEEGWNGSSALRTTNYRYRSSAGQVFPDQFGTSLLRQMDLVSTRNLPQDQRVVTQQSTSFSWEADASSGGFDALARPGRVRKFSSMGDTRTESTTYHDNTALWVLGQVKSVSEGTTTLREMESHTFDPNKATVLSSSTFGKLMQSFTYNADGTVAAVSDAAGRVTLLKSYMRGSPQLVIFPDDSPTYTNRESQVINNLGRPSSRTDANGYTTRYEFDAMGRVAKVIYPGTGYNPTLQGFTQVQSSEFGVPPGHWRQTLSTGNAITVRVFDALWRKRVEQRYDAANPNGTLSYQESRYDARGQKSFESYPERGFNGGVDVSRTGTAFEYDALSRLFRQTASSELGDLITVNQYPGNVFNRITTNPRGFATTFGFQAFDTPSEDSIRSIQAPEGVQVSIVRDVFGKPNSITRGGTSSAGLYSSVTRSYTYDAYQRLCKTIEPETGATQQDYDQANNVAWRASGLAAQSGACNAGNAPLARRISFGYDVLNRPIATTHGDGSPGVTRSYWPDGLPRTISTPTSTWTLDYSPLRKLQSETLSAPGLGSYSFSYGFDANGSVASMTYPGGPTLQYSPDALGRPTAVPGYLSDASYYPNGQLASYNGANRVNYTASQNTRLLPSSMTYGNVSAETYRYDANGNVDAISGANARAMGYDGLDRLTAANGIWGQGRYSYDTVDNIRSSAVGTRGLTHYYDGSNRLYAVRGSLNVDATYDANGNVSRRDTQGFAFDIANRLVTEALPSSNPQLTRFHYYDGLGRRAYSESYRPGQPLQTTIRLYGQAGQLLMSIDSIKGVTQHFYLGSKLIAEYNSQTLARWVHADALGSPVANTNGNGGLIDRTYYEPYGLPTANGSNPDGIGFTGHVNDVATGLVYMQQRYYDPIAGRFLSVDPVTVDTSSGGSFSRYEYALSNPYQYTDPDGRSGCSAGESYTCRVVEYANSSIQSVAIGAHDIMLAGSFAPGIFGAGFSGLDAGLYALEGDWGGASQAGFAALLGVASDAGVVRLGLAAAKGVAAGEAGAFSALKGLKGDGLTAHHMPQAAAGRTGYGEGGALVMTQAEHVATRTYGSKGVGTLQSDAGMSFRDVLARDIRDVRSIVGSKYNEGLRDLTDYYRRNFPDVIGK